MTLWSLILLAVILSWAGAASGAESTETTPLAGLPEVARGRVAAVEAGGVLRLKDGRRLRPALILAPPPEGGRTDWPYGHRLESAVATLVGGEEVGLRWPARQTDRHGRLVGHVVRTRDGLWLQARLVAEGKALVMPFADETAAAPRLLAVEDTARTRKAGLWADPLFAVRRADSVAARPGVLRLVAGRVRTTAEVRGTVYLNFGADWRSDFTGMLPPATGRACRAAGRDPLALDGHRVRLRGWIRRYNGPLIEITACDQIEVLAETGTAPTIGED